MLFSGRVLGVDTSENCTCYHADMQRGDHDSRRSYRPNQLRCMRLKEIDAILFVETKKRMQHLSKMHAAIQKNNIDSPTVHLLKGL